jgi:hypothetical protein
LDKLKDAVVQRSVEWRDAQKERIAARDPESKERAKNKEHWALKKLGESVDLYQNKGATDGAA